MLTIQETSYSTYLWLIPAVHMLLRVFPDIWAHGVSGDGNTPAFGVKKQGGSP